MFAAGEIVGGLQAAEEVGRGTVEMCHTASYYYWGKDPTFAIATGIPFGLNCRMQNAWMYEGGGIELMNEFYKKYNLYGLPSGNSGAQMGGWYRKEINTPEDWKGLKIRIGGFGGAIMARLGAVPQQIAGGDIYPALEKGTIDAAEWVGPYDDEKLGFYRVAKNYYYPGWWEGQATLHFFFNLDKWNSLPDELSGDHHSAAAQTANTVMMARYDILNPAALRRLVKNGAVLKPFLGGGARRLLPGLERGLRRAVGEERRLQERLRGHDGGARRGIPLVPALRAHQRHLHDDPAAQERVVSQPARKVACQADWSLNHAEVSARNSWIGRGLRSWCGTRRCVGHTFFEQHARQERRDGDDGRVCHRSHRRRRRAGCRLDA